MLAAVTEGELRLARPLRPGDRVALVAPAGPVHAGLVERGVAVLRSLGLEPVEMAHTRESTGFLAGPDEHRLADLLTALCDPAFAGVFCLRGGYGSQRLVEAVDWTALPPKVFVGYSDVTALHLALYQRARLVSFHGPNVEWDPLRLSDAAAAALQRAVMDPAALGTLAVRGATMVAGTARGPLVGGNLALVASTLGTADAAGLDGALLLLEDVGERPYAVDRSLTQLARAGVLAGAAGLVLGKFTRCVEDRPGRSSPTVEEVLREHALRAGIPAVAGLPLGHGHDQLTVPHGAPAVLDATAGTLTFPAAALTAVG